MNFRLIGMDKEFHERFKHSYTTNTNRITYYLVNIIIISLMISSIIIIDHYLKIIVQYFV